MTEERRFTFVNEDGETIKAWKGEDGAVHFTHTDDEVPAGVHVFIPSIFSVCPAVMDGVLLSPEEIYFLLGVWLGKAEEG